MGHGLNSSPEKADFEEGVDVLDSHEYSISASFSKGGEAVKYDTIMQYTGKNKWNLTFDISWVSDKWENKKISVESTLEGSLEDIDLSVESLYLASFHLSFTKRKMETMLSNNSSLFERKWLEASDINKLWDFIEDIKILIAKKYGMPPPHINPEDDIDTNLKKEDEYADEVAMIYDWLKQSTKDNGWIRIKKLGN